MSENFKLICPECGNENEADAKFCIICGTKILQNTDRKVEAEATENIADAQELSEETPLLHDTMGEEVSSDSIASEEENNAEPTPTIRESLEALGDAAQVAAVSKKEGKMYDLNFSALDLATYSISSLCSMSEYQIRKTDAYKEKKEYLDTSKKGKLDKSEYAEKVIKNELQIELMRSSSPFKVSLFVGGIIAILYMALCAVFGLLSLIALTFEILRACNIRAPRLVGLERANVAIIFCLFAISPLIIYTQLKAWYFGVSERFGYFSSGGIYLGWGLIISLVLIVLSTAYFVARNIRGARQKLIGKKSKTTKKAIVSLVSCILILVSIFLPLTQLDLSADVGKGKINTEKFGITIFNLNEFTSLDVSAYSASSRLTSYEKVGDAIPKMVQRPSVYDKNVWDIFNTTIIGYERIDLSVMYILIYISATLLFLFVGLLSWRTIKNLFINKNETNTNGLKVVTLIFSIIYFGLSAAMSIIADSNLSGNLLAVMQFKTGIGPVLAFVFSIVLVRTIKKNVEDDARWEYDNPDTSYAPYVVGYRSNKK